MKKFISFTLIATLVSTSLFYLESCTKIKDESFSVEIFSEGFEPTDEDITAIVASSYNSWRKILLLWNGYWRVQENSADQIVTPPRPNGWVDGGIYRRIHRHTWTIDDDICYQTWTRTYNGIANCNQLIFNVTEGGLLPKGEAQTKTVAEIKMVRASYYYVLCDMYGNVPIDTLFNVEEGYMPKQNTRKEVFDFIVNEIKSSIPYLSTERGGAYYNHFNVWSAKTLLAKMYLNSEVYTGTPMWNECQELCNEIISESGYSLEASQKNVFLSENENSNEIMFGIVIDDNYTTDWNAFDIHMQSLQPANQATFDLTATPWGGMCAIPQFIDTFDPDDKRLTQNFIMGQQYSSSGEMLYCALDPVGEPLAYTNEVMPIDQVSLAYHGYRFGKFEIGSGSSNILNNDFPLLRYADVLMMKAECLLRTGDADGAAVLVTEVRSRSFNDAAKATVTGAQLLEGSSYEYGLRDEGNLGTTNEGGADIQYGRFLDELGWEFNQEGRRRQDMIRFGAFSTKSRLGYEGSPSKKYTNLYAIPQAALNTNNNLKQNEGY